jgi:NAD(P)H-hydrate epimerase
MPLPVLSPAEMRRIEAQTFSSGVTADHLMEKVGHRVAQAVAQFVPSQPNVTVYYGKGHNGGDALVAARYLAEAGCHVQLRPQESDPAKLAPLTAAKLYEFQSLERTSFFSLDPRPVVILDGLLGIGATGPLRDDIRALTREINLQRSASNAQVFAIDIPTGLDADTGASDPDCVIADVTVTAGFAKTGLVADSATPFVGRIAVADLPDFRAPATFDAQTATPASLAGLLPRRDFDSHKTQYGRVAIIAGSPGFTGAAILCATGALRAGAGLVTLYATEDIQPILAVAAPPEVMVHPVKSYVEVLEQKHDVLAIGPGLGKARADEILYLVEFAEPPIVLDADALNIVAAHGPDVLARSAGPRLLTPHPGEMLRLFPESKALSRLDTATQFTARFAQSRSPITLLLKGARTIVHQHGLPVSYNTTGHPAMGTGGMGDVLTGVCAALIGQHLLPYDAARLGAWLCGHTAELSRASDSLTALDVAHSLGPSLSHLRSNYL